MNGIETLVTRRAWAATLLALALLPAVQLACARSAPARARRVVPSSDIAGRWSGELQGDRLQLEIKIRKAFLNDWSSVDSYPTSQLAGFTPGAVNPFELRRDAGTFHFEGSFQGGRGQGRVTFRPNPEFAHAVGVPIPSSGLLELAVYDVSLGYAREMKDLGLVTYSRQKLKGWKGLWGDMVGRREPPVQRLIELKIHGVTPEFVRGMHGRLSRPEPLGSDRAAPAGGQAQLVGGSGRKAETRTTRTARTARTSRTGSRVVLVVLAVLEVLVPPFSAVSAVSSTL